MKNNKKPLFSGKIVSPVIPDNILKKHDEEIKDEPIITMRYNGPATFELIVNGESLVLEFSYNPSRIDRINGAVVQYKDK